jgi:hypothetical protein
MENNKKSPAERMQKAHPEVNLVRRPSKIPVCDQAGRNSR